MDPSHKEIRKPHADAGVLVRGRPAREGDKTRAGIPVAVPAPTSAQLEARDRTVSSRSIPHEGPPDADKTDRRSSPARRKREEAVAYLAHLVSHLRAERERRGMSLTDLSAGSGLDRGMLSKLENGRIENPTFLTLWKYARALGDHPSLIFLDACRSASEIGMRSVAPEDGEDVQ